MHVLKLIPAGQFILAMLLIFTAMALLAKARDRRKPRPRSGLSGAQVDAWIDMDAQYVSPGPRDYR